MTDVQPRPSVPPPPGTPPRPNHQPSQPRLRPGDNTTRGTIPIDAADARHRGLRPDGIPDGGTSVDPWGAPAGASTKDLASLIRGFVDMELADQNDLQAFCDLGRALFHRLAVEVHLAGGELTAGAKEMAKKNRMWGAQRRMARVTKRLDAIGDACAKSAAEFIATWAAFEKEFADILDGAEKKADKPRHFGIKL